MINKILDNLEDSITRIINQEYRNYRLNENIKVKTLLDIIKCRLRNSLNCRRIK
jgi:hypothetical protein